MLYLACIIRIYILTLYIALNLGVMHQIVTLIPYLCYRNVFLESLPFLIIHLIIPSELLFGYTNILPLCKLVHYKIGIMMYKYANCLPPPVINVIYTVNSDIHEHNTRQNISYKLHTNKGSINQCNKCFSNISARVRNALQEAIDKYICIQIQTDV